MPPRASAGKAGGAGRNSKLTERFPWFRSSGAPGSLTADCKPGAGGAWRVANQLLKCFRWRHTQTDPFSEIGDKKRDWLCAFQGPPGGAFGGDGVSGQKKVRSGVT